MKEKWKFIDNCNQKYQISNLGRVKSFAHDKNGRLRKTSIFATGYECIGLKVTNKKLKYFSVHRLVAKAFIKNPLSRPCVNHIDANKTNNNVNNLEWVTYKENIAHAHKNNLKTTFEWRPKKGSLKVLCKELQISFPSCTLASKFFGCSKDVLANCVRTNGLWKFKGKYTLLKY